MILRTVSGQRGRNRVHEKTGKDFETAVDENEQKEKRN